jgi:Flp pilus assembly pilin Flp
MLNALRTTFARLRKDEKGVTLVEYGIALVLAVTLGSAALAALAGNVDQKMDQACGVMSGTTTGANCSTANATVD